MDVQNRQEWSLEGQGIQVFDEMRPSHEGASDGTGRINLAGASQLKEYVKRTVELAPPLSREQRDRLALLLRPREGSKARTAG